MRLTEKLWEQYKKASFSQIPCGYLTKFALSFSASSLQKYIFPQLFKNKFYMWYPFTCRYLNVYCPAPQKRSYWNFMLSQYILYSKENPDWYVFSFVSWLSFNLITQSFFVFRDIDLLFLRTTRFCRRSLVWVSLIPPHGQARVLRAWGTLRSPRASYQNAGAVPSPQDWWCWLCFLGYGHVCQVSPL